MKRGGRFPDDQAEVVFSDVFVEQLEDLPDRQRLEVLGAAVALCADPGGKHPLRAPLAGWNTLEVLGGHHRIVYKASVEDGSGLVEVLCMGRRSDEEVYDMARGLVGSGCIPAEEATALWESLALLDVMAAAVGLEGWDFRPPPAPEGMRRAAVAAGVMTAEEAALLSTDELQVALEAGWDEVGNADPERALEAALARARDSGDFVARFILARRDEARCSAVMPRAQRRCIRRRDHPGPHRAT